MTENICGHGYVNTEYNEYPESKEIVQNKTDGINMALAMDSTAVQIFTLDDNTKYSEEIVDEARALFNLEKLEELKAQMDLTEFYAEGKL